MNYERIYNQLIEKRRKNPISKKDGYCERHHIVPKSFGGTNTKDNVINLTAKEHFVAHHLLVKVMEVKYGKSSKEYEKMVCAWWRFSYSNKTKQKVNSSEYQKLKYIFSKMQSERASGEKNGMYGRRGKLNPMYGKSCLDFMTDEQIENWKKGNSEHHKGKIPWCKGKKFTEEEKLKYNNIGKHKPLYGKDNPMYGKPCYYKMTEEEKALWKKHIGEAGKGRKKSPEEIEKLRKANLGKKRSKETKLRIHENHWSPKGRKHMYDPKTNIRKLVDPKDFEEYLNKGYLFGNPK